MLQYSNDLGMVALLNSFIEVRGPRLVSLQIENQIFIHAHFRNDSTADRVCFYVVYIFTISSENLKMPYSDENVHWSLVLSSILS